MELIRDLENSTARVGLRPPNSNEAGRQKGEGKDRRMENGDTGGGQKEEKSERAGQPKGDGAYQSGTTTTTRTRPRGIGSLSLISEELEAVEAPDIAEMFLAARPKIVPTGMVKKPGNQSARRNIFADNN